MYVRTSGSGYSKIAVLGRGTSSNANSCMRINTWLERYKIDLLSGQVR